VNAHRLLLALAPVAALALCCAAGADRPAARRPEDPVRPAATPVPADPVAAELLRLHNAARASARPAPVPALPPLGWSAAAASAAQAWADRCEWGHDPSLPARGMGQNIFAAASSAPEVVATPAEAVGSWVGEAASYHHGANRCDAGKVCGHYTAVVWRTTTAVGCAHRRCTRHSPFGAGLPRWDYWVCNYVPPGNWVGEKPY
jgi:hypothetical protein